MLRQAQELFRPQTHVLRRDVVGLEELPHLGAHGHPQIGPRRLRAVVGPVVAGQATDSKVAETLIKIASWGTPFLSSWVLRM